MSKEMQTAIELAVQHNTPSAKIHNGQVFLLDRVTGRGIHKCSHYQRVAV